MAKRQPPVPPQRHDLEIEANGKTHHGHYTLDRGMITVTLLGGGTTTTHQSASQNNDVLARIVLAELVAKQKA